MTDILYFGDRFAYHAVAQNVAREFGIACHAVEFGYLRPGWLTLERGGMSAYSHFPNDPPSIRAIAKAVAPVDTQGHKAHKMSKELTFELLFGIINEYYMLPFPFYRNGRGYIPVTLEYISGYLHLRRRRAKASARDSMLAPYLAGETRFVLVPLQLQSDYQIRENTAYRDQKHLLREVIQSFARHAAAGMHLLVKLHPMDPGLIRWDKVVAAIAAEVSIQDRVFCFDGGDLDALIAKSSGVIVSNSTVGLTSLRAGVPTLALGWAVYDVPGMTHQTGLDRFWTTPEAVDDTLCDAFVQALAATIQIRGSVYDPAGRAVACAEIVRRVLDRRVNEPMAFVDPPPRLSMRRNPFSLEPVITPRR
ncbi:MAG TPA: capsular biosynthesis protein [Rhabdaerophilum sp.]|nr:capsular biosynthesis protein [Rhabdaerophilum sp.]